MEHIFRCGGRRGRTSAAADDTASHHNSPNHHGSCHLHPHHPVQGFRWERWIRQHPEQRRVPQPGDLRAPKLCEGTSQELFIAAVAADRCGLCIRCASRLAVEVWTSGGLKPVQILLCCCSYVHHYGNNTSTLNSVIDPRERYTLASTEFYRSGDFSKLSLLSNTIFSSAAIVDIFTSFTDRFTSTNMKHSNIM